MSTQPPKPLPPQVQKLQLEVEKLSGHEIWWQEDAELTGHMRAEWVDNEPIVWYRSFSVGGAAEELLHLRLALLGFRTVRNTDQNKHTAQALTILVNLLQHAVIFPVLDSFGYPKDQGECESVRRQFSQALDLDTDRFKHEPRLVALYAMLYARAGFHCEEDAFNAIKDEHFELPDYEVARTMGERVLAAIDLNETSTATEYESTLRRCVETLGLQDVTRIVDPRDPDEE